MISTQVAFWLVCLAVFLAGLWERTMLPMRSKSRADPIYYTGIVMIAVGTLVLLCYFVVRLERVRSAARTPFSPSDIVRVFTRGSRAISTTGATYLDLHLFCVYIAGVALVIAIVLGLTLGPDKARKVSRRYDDEGAGDDERVFREGAYVRCGLLALILAVFGLGVRLRRVAGAPTTRRLASRSIELTSHAS